MKKSIYLALMLIITTSLTVGCNNKQKDPNPTPTANATSKQQSTAVPTSTVTPTPPPKPEPGSNVALHKNYEVSSETSSEWAPWGWASEFVNDGIKENNPLSQGFTTDVKLYMELEDWEDEWVMIDIGQVVSIDKVVLYPRQDTGIGFPCDYYIEVSADNKTYTTVATVTDNLGEEPNYDPAILTFNAVDARYVRLVVTKPWPQLNGSDGYLVQIAEFEIYAAPSGKE